MGEEGEIMRSTIEGDVLRSPLICINNASLGFIQSYMISPAVLHGCGLN